MAGSDMANGSANSLTDASPDRQPGEDGPAGGIGEGGEDCAEMVRRHFSFNLSVT